MASRVLIFGLAALLLFGFASPALAQAPATRPVFFAPLRLAPGIRANEELLRGVLSAGMVSSGGYVETVTGESSQAVDACVRAVNADTNAETCWVRLGQGQGAELLVSGKVTGDARSCALMLSLTELESRVAIRKHVQFLEPCGKKDLRQEMRRAASVLAGVSKAGPSPNPGPTVSPPPPAGGRDAQTQQAPPPPSAAVGSLSVVGGPNGARVDIVGPGGFNRGEPLTTSLPVFPPKTVPAGEYRVIVSAPGYEPFEARKLIPALGTWAVDARLKPNTATLLLSGEPAGASTTLRCGPDFAQKPREVEREPFGLPANPFSFTVPAGSCRVKVSLVGWQDYEELVPLRGGEERKLRVRLVKGSPPAFQEAERLARQTAELELRFPERVFRTRLKKKAELIRRAAGAYSKAMDSGSSYWKLASRARLGDLYAAFCRELRSAPSPPELTDDQQAIYRTALEDKAAVFCTRAGEAYTLAVEQARREQLEGEFVERAEAGLRSLK